MSVVVKPRLQKMKELTARDWWMLAVFSVALPITWCALRIIGFPRVHAYVHSRGSEALSGTEPSIAAAKRAARCVEIAARHGLYSANCLHRSVALCWYLRGQGVDAIIRVGVSPDIRDFRAHAWVEVAGESLDVSSSQFVAFDQLMPTQIDSLVRQH
jgi:Transglutaminase-like superfamily